MIINGSFYPATSNGTESTETNAIDSLAKHMSKTETAVKSASDTVTLSKEAYAALKEHAPEALEALDLNRENPVLDEVKEIAKEKYFHFGSEYLSIEKTPEEMISALDVANRYMDALNSIEPDEIYEALADINRESADSRLSANDISELLQYV